MLNIYPHRATNIKDVSAFDSELHKENLKHIIEIINKYHVKEV
jgi:DNA-directed RNA polymerase subunit F